MSGRRKSVWRVVVASVAACLLVMQTIFGSLALAADIAPARDTLGSIICISHPDAGVPSDHKDGHKLPSCCVLGCAMFSPGLPSATSGSLIDTRLAVRDVPIGVESDAAHFARPEIHPHNPRAPPVRG